MTKNGMSSDRALPKEIDQALTRSRLYKLFAVALADPAEGFLTALKDGFYISALEEEFRNYGNGTHQLHPEEFAKLKQIISEIEKPGGRRQLIEDYTQIFVHPGSAAQPYETEYTTSHAFMKAHQVTDIMGFYRAFGLDLSEETKDRPDSLVTELEFMHFLCLKEAAARTKYFGHIDLTVDAEKKFLSEHVGRWVKPFAKSIQHAAPQSVYSALLQILHAFLKEECRLHATTPAPAKGPAEEKEEVGLCEENCPLVESYPGEGEGK